MAKKGSNNKNSKKEKKEDKDRIDSLLDAGSGSSQQE